MSYNQLSDRFVLETHFRRSDLSFNHKRMVFLGKDVRFLKTLFINSLIKQGKKIRAEFWVHNLFYAFKQHMRIKMSPAQILYYTFMQLRPLIVLRKAKLGRTLYYLPSWINRKKQNALAVRLLLKSARVSERGSKRISLEKLLELFLLNLLKKDNIAIQQRIALHKEVQESLAFSHLLKWL